MKLGHILMKISLVAQIIVIAVFCLLGATFQRRCYGSGIRTRSISALLIMLYISTGLIFIRCVYRIIEHFGASRIHASSSREREGLGPIMHHEWFFYMFEPSLTLVNTCLWNWQHPRRYLPAKLNICLVQNGETELKRPGWKDQRPFLVTFCDPFGWFDSNKTKERPF